MEKTLTPDFEIKLNSLVEAINLKYDYDFRDYSAASMKRRLVQAMSRMGFDSLGALHEQVILDPLCFSDLLQSLTISVSELFRNPIYYLALREKVIPHLRTYPSLKIWVAGCGNGEEVYSLAILLHEEDLLDRTIIYATDINQRCLEKAEKGTLPLDDIHGSVERYQNSGGKRTLSDYFSISDDTATFSSFLQKNVSFFDHSLATDTVFSETHLISCRNVLIYFNRDLQERVIDLFYESLCRNGFLGIGLTKTIPLSQGTAKFEPFYGKARIYQKN